MIPFFCIGLFNCFGFKTIANTSTLGNKYGFDYYHAKYLNMGEENSSAFKCVKISLIVLYVLSIIAIVIFIAVVIFGLAILGTINDDSDQKLSPQEKEVAKMAMIGAIIVFAISLIVEIIGLIGVIKENKCIVITITVFSALGVIAYFIKGSFGSALFGILVTILTGIYAYMIIEKQKRNSSV